LDLLVDTHALAWLASGDRRLGKALVAALADPDTRLFVSAVTAYEYADLQARGRLPESVDIAAFQTAFGFHLLDYPAALWQVAAELPKIHRDPVDRMTIAHARALNLTLVTADKTVRRYPVRTLW
jgi:PIN domain nuclease of toxin-antitoxin system